MNESAVSKRLIDALKALGAEAWKMSDRFNSSRPDIWICHLGRFMVIETKVYPNEPTAAQKHELDKVIKADGIAYVATYNKSTRWITILDYIHGHSVDFKDIRMCAQWLLRHRT